MPPSLAAGLGSRTPAVACSVCLRRQTKTETETEFALTEVSSAQSHLFLGLTRCLCRHRHQRSQTKVASAQMPSRFRQSARPAEQTRVMLLLDRHSMEWVNRQEGTEQGTEQGTRESQS